MDSYRNGRLFLDHVSLDDLASKYQTPFYAYSKRRIEKNVRRVQEALDSANHLFCYPLEINFSLGILKILCQLGAGFSARNSEELQRVLKVGGDTRKIIFAGPGKSRESIAAAIAHNVYCIHAESWQELERIEEMAREAKKVTPVGLRINPEVEAGAHPYLAYGATGSKFGLSFQEVMGAFRRVSTSPFMEVTGIGYDVGSQILTLDPFLEASAKIMTLVDRLKGEGILMKHVDVGGGTGVPYMRTGDMPSLMTWIRHVSIPVQKRGIRVICEPGRSTLADVGVLVTRVEYVKNSGGKRFLVVDAGMNDFIRTPMYGSQHTIKTVREGVGARTERYDVVGPISECADFFARGREPPATSQGDLLAIVDVGAYGFAMSSNYNSRNLLPENLVDGPNEMLIRKRQTLEQQIENERVAL
ncbi:unnamed protein product [Ixodes hexagonus]